MASMSSMMGTARTRYTDPLQKVDLDVEYALIKQKKSKLSAALRSRVVHMVEHRDKES